MERQKSGSFRNKRPALLTGPVLGGPAFPKRSQLLHRTTPRPLGTRPRQGDKIVPSQLPLSGLCAICTQSIT